MKKKFKKLKSVYLMSKLTTKLHQNNVVVEQGQTHNPMDRTVRNEPTEQLFFYISARIIK